tara:strand:- start:170 stop:697 length:528 start_codon:yes stop_codon:yes gene_type:complete
MRFKNKGVLWITGLSGSGKTTISQMLLKEIKKKNIKAIHLDGDELRKTFSSIPIKNSFKREQRKKIGLFYSRLSLYLASQNYIVITSVMALEKEVLTWNRKNISNYNQVFLNIDIKELIKRDPKKNYKMFFQKKIKNLYGIDMKYYKPKNSELEIKSNQNLSKKEITNIIIKNFF